MTNDECYSCNPWFSFPETSSGRGGGRGGAVGVDAADGVDEGGGGEDKEGAAEEGAGGESTGATRLGPEAAAPVASPVPAEA